MRTMPKEYIVKSGDTLSRIAQRECGGVSFVQQIMTDNQIASANRIFPGQKLILRCGDSTTPTNTAPVTTLPVEELFVAPPELDPYPQPVTTIPPDQTGRVRLNVPHYSQENTGAFWAANDCGPACVRMVLGWDYLRRGQADPTSITVDTVTKASGIGPRGYSTPATLERVGRKYALNFTIVSKTATMERIKQEISAGRPVICLVAYGKISSNQSNFKGGHYITVVGYDSQHMICHDPLWWGARINEGAYRLIPTAQLDAAMQPASPWFSIPYQALFINPT